MKFLNLLFIPLLAFLVLSCSSDDLEDIIDPKTVPDSNTGSTKSIDLSQGLAPQNLLNFSGLRLLYPDASTATYTPQSSNGLFLVSASIEYTIDPVNPITTIEPDSIGTSGTATWSLVSKQTGEVLSVTYVYDEINVVEGTFTYNKSNPDISTLNLLSGTNSDSSVYTLIFESSTQGRFIDQTSTTSEDGSSARSSYNGTFSLF